MAGKIGTTTKKKAMTKAELEESSITNFTNLQRVLTNLSLKFEDLSNNMSKLLQLFEISAKSFAEKYSGKSEELEKNTEKQIQSQNESDKKYLEKLDSLLDQNKTIAKGIMLMEGRIRQRDDHPQEPQPPQTHQPRPNYSPKPESRLSGMFKSKPLPKY